MPTLTGERIVYSHQPDSITPGLWTRESDGTYWSHYTYGQRTTESFVRVAGYADGAFTAPGYRRTWSFNTTHRLWSIHNGKYVLMAFELPGWDPTDEVGEPVRVRGMSGVAVMDTLGGMVAWRREDRVVLQVATLEGGSVDEALAVANRLIEIDEAAWLQIADR